MMIQEGDDSSSRYQMRNCNCRLFFAAGICSCGLAIAGAETAEYKRPSAPACFSPPIYRDFGPPAECENDTLPHNRMSWVTSVAASSGTSINVFAFVPTVAYTARDAEDGAETNDPGFAITLWRDPPKSKNGGSSSDGDPSDVS
jgi:hypothetical protein